MARKNAPDLSSPSSPGSGSVCEGDDTIDTDCSLEAPRRPRSEAQIAAFEKARAKRAANRAAGGVTPLKPPTSPSPEPAAPPPAPAAPAAPPAPKRKTRTDKGKKRGYIVKEHMEEDYPPEGSREGGLGGGSPPGYMNFVIV